jgi:hypothetical protein
MTREDADAAYANRIWNELTTRLPADKKSVETELLDLVMKRSLVEEGATERGEDDCIIIWPSRGLVGKSSLFPRLESAGDMLAILQSEGFKSSKGNA